MKCDRVDHSTRVLQAINEHMKKKGRMDREKPRILSKPSKPFAGCPFCGSPAVHISDEKRHEWLIVVHKDGCFFLRNGLPTRTQHISMDEVDAWNRRAE